MGNEQSVLGRIQDWFTEANDVGVPRTPYTAAILNDPNKGVKEIDPTIPVIGPALVNAYTDYSKAGGGFTGVGAALRGDYDRSVDWTSRNIIEPPFYPAQMYQEGQNAFNGAVGGIYSGISKGPEQAARDFQAEQAANHADATIGASNNTAPKAALPPVAASYVTGKAPYDPTYVGSKPQIPYQSNFPPGMMDKPIVPAIVESLNKQGVNGPLTAKAAYVDALIQDARALPGGVPSSAKEAMEQKGYSPVNQPFTSGDGSAPANIYYKTDGGKTRYELPGTKGIGGAPGFVEFQGVRKGGGSFSVMPGLSDGEKRQYQEIMAREQFQRDQAMKQNAMADYVNRFMTPPGGMNELDSKLWAQRQDGLKGLMAVQAEQERNQAATEIGRQKARQEQAQFKATFDQKQAEIAQKGQENEDTMDWRAAQLNQSNVASQRKALRVDPKFIPTQDSIITSARKSAIDGLTKLKDHEVLAQSMGRFGAPSDDPNSMYFTDSKQPGVVFFRDPRQGGKVSKQTLPIDHYLKQWAYNMYKGMGDFNDRTESPEEVK